MHWTKIVICFFLLTPVTLFSQSNEVDKFIDELLGGDDLVRNILKSSKEYHALQVGIDFNEKTFFSGRDIGIDQFHLVPAVSYIHSKGFFSSISGVYYSGFSPKWDYTAVVIGYGRSFDKLKQFNWSFSYTRYFYSNDIENLFKNAVSGSFDYLTKNKNFGTTLEVSYLFGGDNSFQTILSTFKEFELFKGKEIEFSLRPQAEIVVAEQTLENVSIEGNGANQEVVYTQNKVFGLINTSIKIPIQCSYKSFDFEVGYTLNIPNSLPEEEFLKAKGFFTIGVTYMFLFN